MLRVSFIFPIEPILASQAGPFSLFPLYREEWRKVHYKWIQLSLSNQGGVAQVQTDRDLLHLYTKYSFEVDPENQTVVFNYVLQQLVSLQLDFKRRGQLHIAQTLQSIFNDIESLLYKAHNTRIE